MSICWYKNNNKKFFKIQFSFLAVSEFDMEWIVFVVLHPEKYIKIFDFIVNFWDIRGK